MWGCMGVCVYVREYVFVCMYLLHSVGLLYKNITDWEAYKW